MVVSAHTHTSAGGGQGGGLLMGVWKGRSEVQPWGIFRGLGVRRMRLEPWRIATCQREVKKQKPEKRQQRIQKTGVSWKQKKKIISREYGFADKTAILLNAIG